MVLVAALLINVLYAFIIVMFVRIIFSWISPYPTNRVTRIFWQATEPVLAPIRRRLPLMSGIDLSPLVVWVAALILIRVLSSFA